MRWKILFGMATVIVAMGAAQNTRPKYVPPAPVQPIPYSHRQHMAAGLQCKDCHEMPEPGEFAGLPETAKCMSCHTAIKKDSTTIQKLAEYHNHGDPVPWVRVYRIPDFVYFSHKEHLAQAKVTCGTCHGPVRERDVMRKETDISMAGCMDCHRANNASLACDFCHVKR